MDVPIVPNPSLCVSGPQGVVATFTWDLRLVVLSVAIAIAGSFVGLECASRVRAAATPAQRRAFSLLGAALMGLAIWSMHFVGMLALRMGMPVSYAPGWSLLSVVAAAVGAGIAFAVVNQPRIGWFHILTGGVAMGLAIVTMHYLGMKSLRMPATIDYEPIRFGCSILIAIGASAGALALGNSLPRSPRWEYALKAGSSVGMGIAIAGMHYEGMAAARYYAATVAAKIASEPRVGSMAINDLLAIAAVVFAAALIALALGAAVDRQRALTAYQELASELEARVRMRTAELETMNQDLSAFSYTVSHDLRGPLRTIVGFTDVIFDSHAEELTAEVRSHISRIQNAAIRMDALLSGLLHMANVSRARMERTEVDLSQLARGILADCAAQEPQRRAEVVIAPDLHAFADATLVTSLLQNLLHNAWKFSAGVTPSRIEFGRAATAQGPAFFVRDNGAGFDIAHAAKLFGMFERLHHSSEFPGHGIGLAIGKRIVERHGGRMWAESAPGAGATFWFTLAPERPGQAPSERSAPA